MPSEVTTSFKEDYERAVSAGGYFDLSDWGTIAITGPDAADYLGRMSTVSFRPFDAERVHHGAFLTGRGLVVALGFLQKTGEQFHFLVSSPQAPRAIEHIEQFHFSEQFTTVDESDKWALFGVWGPPASFADWNSAEPLRVYEKTWGGVTFEMWRDDTRPKLFWVKIKRQDSPQLIRSFQDAAIAPLGRRLYDYFRIQVAVPEVGREATEKDIILETGFERAVARNKGCYPGQEVVERIFTYGSVNRKLLPVELRRPDNAPFPEAPFPIDVEGKAVGEVVSWVEDPLVLGRARGLAYVQKAHWDRREPFGAVPGLEVTLCRE